MSPSFSDCFKTHLNNIPVSETTRKRYVRNFERIIEWGVSKEELLSANPTMAGAEELAVTHGQSIPKSTLDDMARVIRDYQQWYRKQSPELERVKMNEFREYLIKNGTLSEGSVETIVGHIKRFTAWKITDEAILAAKRDAEGTRALINESGLMVNTPGSVYNLEWAIDYYRRYLKSSEN